MMYQILQDLRSGDTRLVEVPAPSGRGRSCYIQARRSVVSAGTERMLVNAVKLTI